MSIRNNEVVEELVDRHKDELPKEFLKYFEVKKDDEYVIKKARKYSEQKNGIDPNIKIGVEIEANNKINVFFNIQYQKGLEGYYPHTDATVPDRY